MKTSSVSTLAFLLTAGSALGLNPQNSLTQYNRAMWTQASGLPQDTIKAIAQTSDGYLWLGTDEGLSRFDGYEFVNFSTDNGLLPSNAIESLAVGRDDVLWIGTANGLVRYRAGQFRTFTTADGLPDNYILSVCEDHNGVLWLASGVYLNRFENGKFTTYAPDSLLPVRRARAIYEDSSHTLLIAGLGGLVKKSGDSFVPVISTPASLGLFFSIARDREGSYWIGGRVLVRQTAGGKVEVFHLKGASPSAMVRSVIQDRDGNVWIGTTQGISRFVDGRFIPQALYGRVTDNWVHRLFEDREGNLWVGMSNGLYRFHDPSFTNYGREEGFPSDEPLSVHQDRRGHIWIGYHGDGLLEIDGKKHRTYTTNDGLAKGEVMGITDISNGDVLAITRYGVSRVRDGRITPFVVPDNPAYEIVYSVLEDSRKQLWAATSDGVYRIVNGRLQRAVPRISGGSFQASTALAEAPDGSIWAGTYGRGLWRIDDQGSRRFTAKDGLSSERIRALFEDRDGTLWIATFGGGLNAWHDGRFVHLMARDGLLSDNIAHIDEDRAGDLWLATTRGISRIARDQIVRFIRGDLPALNPLNYTVADGLRSAQCAPGYPIASGGTRSEDGRIWFPTTRGLAVWNPDADTRTRQSEGATVVHIISARADQADLTAGAPHRLSADLSHVDFRYSAIHLSAPERVRYQYMLEGLDQAWSSDTDRRVVGYNTLRHGNYRFRVRASALGGPWAEDSVRFEVLPHFYERSAFLWLCAAALAGLIVGVWQSRLRQIHSRYALVLEERTRIAHEIHDTLAQGFVGIASQLDAVAVKMGDESREARDWLETARKMARHSITEARRSVMDLREPELQDHDLGSAIHAAALRWQINRSTPVRVTVSGDAMDLPAGVQQDLLRIAQEAVVNAFKHSRAAGIGIELLVEPDNLQLTVRDDGEGFRMDDLHESGEGHFGLLGMRERAERLGGKLDLSSSPGSGTVVCVRVPLARQKRRSDLWQDLLGPLKPGTNRAP